MNSLAIQQSVLEPLAWTLIHFLWEGALIAAFFAIAIRLLDRGSPSSRYFAGCVALTLMALAPVTTFLCLRPVPTLALGDYARAAGAGGATDGSATLILTFVAGGWVAGVIALAVRHASGWLAVRRLTRTGARQVVGSLARQATVLATRLRISRPIRLLESQLVDVPVVAGWLRPAILFPAACLTGLSPAHLEAILAHELAHIRRCDYLVNLLQSVLETLLFYHPAVWWISERVREEREHCCDEIAAEACGNRIAFARALTALEELRGCQQHGVPLLAMAADGGDLLRRIRRLLGLPPGPRRSAGASRRGSSLAKVLAAVAILGLSAALIGQGLRASRSVRHYEAAQASLRVEVAEARQTGAQETKAEALKDAEIDRLRSATREIYVLRAQASELRTIRDENMQLRRELMRLKAQTKEGLGQTTTDAGNLDTPSEAAASDGLARVWDLQTGRELRTITGLDHELEPRLVDYLKAPLTRTNVITHVAFSPDGKRLVTGVRADWIISDGVEVQLDGPMVDYSVLGEQGPNQILILDGPEDGDGTTDPGTVDLPAPDE